MTAVHSDLLKKLRPRDGCGRRKSSGSRSGVKMF